MKWGIPLCLPNFCFLLMTKCNVTVQVDRETIELLASLNMPQLPGVVQQVWIHCLQPYFFKAKSRGNWTFAGTYQSVNESMPPDILVTLLLLYFYTFFSYSVWRLGLCFDLRLLLKLVSILMLNVLLVKQAAPPAGGGFFKPQVGGFQGGNFQGNRNRS